MVCSLSSSLLLLVSCSHITLAFLLCLQPVESAPILVFHLPGKIFLQVIACLSLLLPQWGLLWLLTLYEIIPSLFSLTLFHKFLKRLYCLCIYFLPSLLECKVCKVRDFVILFPVVFLFPEQIVAQNTCLMYIYWLSGEWMNEWMNEGKETYSFSS